MDDLTKALMDIAEHGFSDGVSERFKRVQNRVEKLETALKPFSHPDLHKLLSGNCNGDDSIVFVRDKAILTIGDFKREALAVVNYTREEK